MWRRIIHLAWEHTEAPFLHCLQIIKWCHVSSQWSILCTMEEPHLGREVAAGPVTSQLAMALHLSGNKQCIWIKNNLMAHLFCALFLPNFNLFEIKNNCDSKQNKNKRGILGRESRNLLRSNLWSQVFLRGNCSHPSVQVKVMSVLEGKHMSKTSFLNLKKHSGQNKLANFSVLHRAEW